MAIFNYDFEELPLVIEGGVPAGFINGQAEIVYSREGSWAIADVTLEGFGERVNGKRQWPQVAAPSPIATIVRSRLQNEWFDKVQNAVNEAIAGDRESDAKYRADARAMELA